MKGSSLLGGRKSRLRKNHLVTKNMLYPLGPHTYTVHRRKQLHTTPGELQASYKVQP